MEKKFAQNYVIVYNSNLKNLKSSEIFVGVEWGEDAREKVIDIAMAKSDAFIFIHTEKSSESDWIQKELRYALLRNIPILWIQIDNADISKLKILPTEKPHLRYSSSDFSDEEEFCKITDEIVQTVFEMIMLRNNKVFGFLECLQNLFGNMLTEVDKTILNLFSYYCLKKLSLSTKRNKAVLSTIWQNSGRRRRSCVQRNY